jgi:transposase
VGTSGGSPDNESGSRSQDLVTFWACHRAAFTHFGGVPGELLYDRTKTSSANTSAAT